MRADFGLYTLAVIFFIIAALPYLDFISVEVLRLDYPKDLTTTVVFVALGLISIILGYSKRPKPVIFVPEVPKPTPPPQEQPQPLREEPSATTVPPPTPTPPSEEPTKPVKRRRPAKTKRKTRRKRKKA